MEGGEGREVMICVTRSNTSQCSRKNENWRMKVLSSGSSEPVQWQTDGEDVDDVDYANKEAMLR